MKSGGERDESDTTGRAAASGQPLPTEHHLTLFHPLDTVADGIEWLSSNRKFGGLILSLPPLCAEVSLGKILNPICPS
ncbi:unnamed protein product [Pleuronectes platessa]|uniref:Uncharacterized protein n=1 Tax=Pleuronectes platessa TaxID=8262 RepID=A0A9N7ZDF9_PLEPL|nr:unnamed protein product [Pleuronectes platessa]